MDWPTTWIGDYGINVNTSQLGVYRRESGLWENSFLRNVPPRYRTLDERGSTCETFTANQPTINVKRGLLPRFLSRLLEWMLHWLNLHG